jgi:L-seryl-tRNA(Ser) seleniumtransferase
LKVHTSNYRIVGFTAQPESEKLVALAHEHHLPVVEDLGSGTLLPIMLSDVHEPTVAQSLAGGIDIVTFSGDKLLGAGQAGIIAGKKQYIQVMKKHPLLRAIRIDKLSLAALEGTLIEYMLGEARVDIPVQYMLHRRAEELKDEAKQLAGMLGELYGAGWQIQVVELQSQAGGGAMPGVGLTSFGVSLACKGYSAASVERQLRQRQVPIVVRIQDEKIIFDSRCLVEGDMKIIAEACMEIGKGESR